MGSGVDGTIHRPHDIDRFDNPVFTMATVTFDVPEDVKRAFDKTFVGRNKSAILIDLMREAVATAKRQERRTEAARQLFAEREASETVSPERLDEARRSGRP